MEAMEKGGRSELLTDGPAGDALDLESGFQLREAGLVVLDPRLVHQTGFGVETLDLARENLVEHFGGLAASRHQQPKKYASIKKFA